MSKTAVVVVDVQRDFCEGGSLAVEGGNKVAEEISMYLQHVTEHPEPTTVVFTRDWHVPGSDNGGHFADSPDFVDTWPHHCVQGTDGAEFHDALYDWKDYGVEFLKGQEKPAYSGFEGTMETDGVTTLADYLRLVGVDTVLVCGLAADYCVRATALDAIKEGFETHLLSDLTASIATPVAEVHDEIERVQAVKAVKA